MNKQSQMERIIKALKSARSRGKTSWELAQISLNYTGRVSDLRREGWTIAAERQEGNWFRYRLSGHDL